VTDDLSPDEMSELVTLYVLLNKNGWPLTEEQESDFTDYCQLLLIIALVRSGLTVDTAMRQVADRAGKLRVVVDNGELSVSIEYDEHAEKAIAVSITEVDQ
jgi:hypothetical protein